jgi:hypothetical protein
MDVLWELDVYVFTILRVIHGLDHSKRGIPRDPPAVVGQLGNGVTIESSQIWNQNFATGSDISRNVGSNSRWACFNTRCRQSLGSRHGSRKTLSISGKLAPSHDAESDGSYSVDPIKPVIATAGARPHLPVNALMIVSNDRYISTDEFVYMFCTYD